MENNIDYSSVKTLSIAFVIVFLAILLFVYNVRTYANCENWPIVKGIIQSIDYSTTGGSNSSYTPKVTYEYTVDGKKYVSNKYTSGAEVSFGSEEGLMEFLLDEKGFKEGAPIDIYVSPDKPHLCLIDPTNNFWINGGIFLVVLSIVLVVIGYYLLRDLKLF